MMFLTKKCYPQKTPSDACTHDAVTPRICQKSIFLPSLFAYCNRIYYKRDREKEKNYEYKEQYKKRSKNLLYR